MVREHGVWADVQKWMLWIYSEIEDKRQKSSQKEEPREESKWSSIKNYFSIKPVDTEKQEILNGNILFNTLTDYIYHLTNFGMSLEGGRKLILYFQEKYSLDDDRTRVLIAEFEASQRRGGHILTDREKNVIRIQK